MQESESSAAVHCMELSSSVTEQNGHALSIEAEDDLLSYIADNEQKSKKQKKRRTHRDDRTENLSRDVVEPDISTATCDGSTKSDVKKRKKKCHEDVAGMAVCDNGDKKAVVAEDCLHKVKKSAKRSKNNSSDVQSTDESRDVRHTSDDFCKQTKNADGKNFNLLFILDL